MDAGDLYRLSEPRAGRGRGTLPVQSSAVYPAPSLPGHRLGADPPTGDRRDRNIPPRRRARVGGRSPAVGEWSLLALRGHGLAPPSAYPGRSCPVDPATLAFRSPYRHRQTWARASMVGARLDAPAPRRTSPDQLLH